MTTATMTSKGRITIPKSVRDSLHLRTGDRVAFIFQNGTEAMLKPVSKSVDEVYGKLHTPGAPVRSVAQMREAVARRLGGRAS